MPVVRLNTFGGMVPAVDDRLIPDTAAADANNVWLYSGAARPLPIPTPLAVLDDATLATFRVPHDYSQVGILDPSTWLEFENGNTHVLRAAVADDTYDRYYWLSSGLPAKYNTHAQIISSGGPYTLGVPAPASAPTVTPSTGVSAITTTRSYVYTMETAYGEEGPPSPAHTLTGLVDDSWSVSVPDIPSGVKTGRNLSIANIYRTITSSLGVATFYWVGQADITGTGPYVVVDTALDASVTSNNQLESTYWTPLPADMEGWVSLPNGILAAWRGSEIWFSEPYRYHAWPVQYALALEFPIVGLGVVGQSLIACTSGFPSAITGTTPASMTVSQFQTLEPCSARHTIISAPEGVYYCSANGLILANASGVVNITRELVTRQRWSGFMSLPLLHAARLGTNYYAHNAIRGGAFDADIPVLTDRTDVSFTTGPDVIATTGGDLSGLVVGENIVVSGSTSNDGTYTVTIAGASAVTVAETLTPESAGETISVTTSAFEETAFFTAGAGGSPAGVMIDPLNQRVAMVRVTATLPLVDVTNDPWTGELLLLGEGTVQYMDIAAAAPTYQIFSWKSKEIHVPDPVNFGYMQVFFTTFSTTPTQNATPDHTLVQELSTDQYALVRLYADGVLACTREVRTSGGIFPLAKGYKAQIWQFEIESQVEINSIFMAGTPRELRNA